MESDKNNLPIFIITIVGIVGIVAIFGLVNNKGFVGSSKSFEQTSAEGSETVVGEASTTTVGCTDSDGGKNYNVAGTVSLGRQTFKDSCGRASFLEEYYCQGNKRALQTSYKCQNGCSNGACISNKCGDGRAEGLEQCDRHDLRGYTCQTFGYTSGFLLCTSTCTFDTSGCRTVCGNGIQEGPEQCDGNVGKYSCKDFGYTSGNLTCDSKCMFDLSKCTK